MGGPGHPSGVSRHAARAVCLERTGAVLAQPPARHLHHRGGSADRRGDVNHWWSSVFDRPCGPALGGNQPAVTVAELAFIIRDVRRQFHHVIGGPYGLSAFLTVLALAAGAPYQCHCAKIGDIWPRYQPAFSSRSLLCRWSFGIFGIAGRGAAMRCRNRRGRLCCSSLFILLRSPWH